MISNNHIIRNAYSNYPHNHIPDPRIITTSNISINEPRYQQYVRNPSLLATKMSGSHSFWDNEFKLTKLNVGFHDRNPNFYFQMRYFIFNHVKYSQYRNSVYYTDITQCNFVDFLKNPITAVSTVCKENCGECEQCQFSKPYNSSNIKFAHPDIQAIHNKLSNTKKNTRLMTLQQIYSFIPGTYTPVVISNTSLFNRCRVLGYY